jgi:hypothetical protein
VDDHRGVAKIEVVEQRRGDRGVAVIGIPTEVDRLVGATEARMVGGQTPKA